MEDSVWDVSPVIIRIVGLEREYRKRVAALRGYSINECAAELWVYSIIGYAAELWVYSVYLLSKVPAFFKKRRTLLNGAIIRPILRVKTY